MSDRQLLAGPSGLRAKRRARRHQRIVRGAQLAAIAAVSGAVAMTFIRRESAHAPVSFRVEGAAVGGGGYVEAGEAARPVVRFSDGSEVSLEEKARLHVRASSEHGARITLDEGRAHVYVVHTPETSWIVEAGPFAVTVTGTAFGISWKAAAQRLDVQLESGAVTVSGPVSDTVLSLRAGQWLTVRANEVLIRDLAEVDAGPPPTSEEPSLNGEAAEARTSSAEGPDEASQELDHEVARTGPVAPRRARIAAKPTNRHWAAALVAGRFEAVVDEALRIGIDSAVADSQSEDLAALADAARYSRHHDIARSALVALRRRFPASEHGRAAAFLLGRLSETDDDDPAALSWFESYLTDAPEGRFASEALGRKMNLVQRHEGKDAARPLAEAYLRRFPSGTYAEAARALTRAP